MDGNGGQTDGGRHGAGAAGTGSAGSGAANSGAANSGAANSGAANSGAANSGAANSGAANSGAAGSGAAGYAGGSGLDRYAEWREQRTVAATARAAAEERQRAAEAERADRLIRDFVCQAGERGLAPCRLTARAYDGARYRTGLRGWYLRRDRTIAVDTEGRFYILTVPVSLRARLLGASPVPDRPRLVIGQGGRDGDSAPLDMLLQRRLDAGDAWS